MTNIDQVSEEKPQYNPSKEDKNQKQEKVEHLSETMKAFKEAFESQQSPEERLKMSVAFMKQSLSQDKTPRFKDFWETKKLCLELFKEKMNPLVKAECWNEYTTLSSEAKRLKDLLEEQSAFAIEQIELALQSLEAEFNHPEGNIDKQIALGDCREGTFLASQWLAYDQKQKQIQFYLHLIARMKELRRGIIEHEMRVRHKSRLIKRLSALGDLVLPKKKELVACVTKEFIKDVHLFVEEYFSLESRSVKESAFSPHLLRESIKEFQLLAKQLALSAKAFSETRHLLSTCWEIVKEVGQERKNKFLERQEQLKVVYDEALQLVQVCEKELKESPPATKEELETRLRHVIAELEKKSLASHDFKMLRSQLRRIQDEAAKPFMEQERVHALKKEQELLAKRDAIEAYKEELKQTLLDHHKKSLKSIKELYEGFAEKTGAFKLEVQDKALLEEFRKELYEVLLLKEEEEVAQGDEEALQALLGEWEAFREKARAALQKYRQEMGNSGFDFERAMQLGKAIELEKARLDRAVNKVLELEDKLS